MLPTTAATSIRTEFCFGSFSYEFTITEITNFFDTDIAAHYVWVFYAHLHIFFVSLQPCLIVQAKPLVMHNFELHPEFYNQPILLTEEEKQNPLSVIHEFFEDVKLVEVRIHIHNLLEVTLTRPNTIYDNSSERDIVLCFVKQLEKMVDAAWLL